MGSVSSEMNGRRMTAAKLESMRVCFISPLWRCVKFVDDIILVAVC